MLDSVIQIAQKASHQIMCLYKQELQIELKEDNSLLTQADLLANEIVDSGLKILTPSLPILSEEGEQVEYEVRKNWSSYWCVDPLDGTRGFVQKDALFSVNIALMEQNRPVLGVIVDCLNDRVFYAQKGCGSFMVKDGVKYTLHVKRDFKKALISSHFGDIKTHEYLKKLGVSEFQKMGSSVKFCEVALGNASLYLRRGPTMEWDSASADIILSEAGGGVYEIQEEFDFGSLKRLEYNKKELLNCDFIAL